MSDQASIDAVAAAFAADMGAPVPKSSGKPSSGKAVSVDSVFPLLDEVPGPPVDEDGGDDDADDLADEDYVGDEEGDDSEETGGEQDEENDEEDDDDSSEDMDKKFAVMVDGEEVEVPLKEALQGYIRTETFHRRMNHLSGIQKALVSEAEQVLEQRERVLTMYSDAEATMMGLMPAEPDWDKLYAEDPAGARDLETKFKAFRDKVGEVRSKREAVVAAAAEETARNTARFAQEEFKKFANASKWRDKESMVKDIALMRKTGLAHGLDQKELSTIYDSRMLTLLLKAAKFDRLTANRPKPMNKGNPPASPGAGRKSTAPKGYSGAQRQLNRTGSVEDAAGVFAKMLR